MAIIATARNSREDRPSTRPAVRNNRNNNRRHRNNTARGSRPSASANIADIYTRRGIDTNHWSWQREFGREFDRLNRTARNSGNRNPRPIRREDLALINRYRIDQGNQLRNLLNLRIGGVEGQLSLIHHNIGILDKELGKRPMKTNFEIATEPLLKAAISIVASLALCLIAIFSGGDNQGIILGILISIVALGSLTALGGQPFKAASNSGSSSRRTN
jgi:hypothetical protein